MEKIAIKIGQLPIKAFTLLESLLTLLVTSFILLALSGSVQTAFEQVESQLFFLEFEHFYQESQKLALSSQSNLDLKVSKENISNGYAQLSVPKSVEVLEERNIRFDKAGGNSSLSKISFQTKKETISYQLYIGNGKFKKTRN